jgi:hypothetical protein
MSTKKTTRKRLTWTLVARLEPRLADLLEGVTNTQLEPGEQASDFFYYEVKPRPGHLVGWDRKQGPAILQTSEAYGLVMQVFWAAPPV